MLSLMRQAHTEDGVEGVRRTRQQTKNDSEHVAPLTGAHGQQHHAADREDRRREPDESGRTLAQGPAEQPRHERRQRETGQGAHSNTRATHREEEKELIGRHGHTHGPDDGSPP